MRRLLVLTLFLAVAWVMLGASAAEAQKLRIVTSTTDLKALTEAVTGDLAEVDAMARPNQNPHDLEVRPSLMVKVRRADAMIVNGLELDNWADVVAQGANNQNVIPGAPGRIDASRGLAVLEVPKTRVDRSMGDVHPQGNPHYTLDPGMAPAVTQNILEGLARIAPQHRAAFERNRQQFLARLEEALGRWNQTLEPYKGAPVVVGHAMWVYLLTRFGLVQVGTIEERPGIPPTANHLAKLINLMKEDKVKVIVAEPWSDLKLIQRVAQDAGAQTALLASGVGAVKGTDTFIEAVDFNVKTLAQVLNSAMAHDLLALMWAPFLMCLVLTGIHAYLGLHVIAREVIFVDIALAQIASLGATAAFLWGYDLESLGSYVFGLTFTILGAAVLALSRSRERRVSQEAIIGVVYAVSSAAAVLVADRTAHGAEHLRNMLVGSILAVRGGEVLKVAGLYAGIGIFHWLCRRPFLLISTDPERAYRDGWRVRWWDFLFYASFGVVVTSSVRIAGVLLVFSYLIVPTLAANLRGGSVARRLAMAWCFGTLVSVLAMSASAVFDTPTGATVVCAFGLVLLVLAVLTRSSRRSVPA